MIVRRVEDVTWKLCSPCSAGVAAASVAYSTNASPRSTTERTAISDGYAANRVRSIASGTLPSDGRPVTNNVRPGGAAAAASGAAGAATGGIVDVAAVAPTPRAGRFAGGAPAPSPSGPPFAGRRRFTTMVPSARAVASD